MIIRKTKDDDLNRVMEKYQNLTSYEPHIVKVYLEKEPDLGIVAKIKGKKEKNDKEKSLCHDFNFAISF